MGRRAISSLSSEKKAAAGLGFAEVRAKAMNCKACPLYRVGTQTVFGEGPLHARIFMIGEQPGDREDLEGHPFIGPAGRLLNHCLAQAGLDRSGIYVTNAVKHFKWHRVGHRRSAKKPSAGEVTACRRWLDAELAIIQPELVVALGATAAQALMGPAFRVTQSRGQIFHPSWAKAFIATIHPSSILRSSGSKREEALAGFIADLKKIAALGS